MRHGRRERRNEVHGQKEKKTEERKKSPRARRGQPVKRRRKVNQKTGFGPKQKKKEEKEIGPSPIAQSQSPLTKSRPKHQQSN
jgi:hypothetical protein